jgi:hydrogenase maturation factor
VKDARIACAAGAVHAMHDPTEGGVASALWEMAQASEKRFVVNPQSVPVPAVSRKVCAAFGLNPLASIASGALLLCAAEPDAAAITRALAREGILCGRIGRVESGAVEVQDEQTGLPLERPVRDDITRVYES